MYAEMTTDAFLADDFGLSSFIENDSLMSAIIAGYAASSTTDTEFATDFITSAGTDSDCNSPESEAQPSSGLQADHHLDATATAQSETTADDAV